MMGKKIATGFAVTVGLALLFSLGVGLGEKGRSERRQEEYRQKKARECGVSNQRSTEEIVGILDNDICGGLKRSEALTELGNRKEYIAFRKLVEVLDRSTLYPVLLGDTYETRAAKALAKSNGPRAVKYFLSVYKAPRNPDKGFNSTDYSWRERAVRSMSYVINEGGSPGERRDEVIQILYEELTKRPTQCHKIPGANALAKLSPKLARDAAIDLKDTSYDKDRCFYPIVDSLLQKKFVPKKSR